MANIFGFQYAFTYLGGKGNLLSWILDKIPYSDIYLEPFSGAASVLLNREQSTIEVLNDLNDDIINFFRVLQNSSKFELLKHRLTYTPYSRKEHIHARNSLRTQSFADEIDQAWAFFVCQNQGFGGKLANDSSAWGYSLNAETTPMPLRFANKIANLKTLVARLKKVHLESLDAIEVIKKYDSDKTVIYCDPPYLKENRTKTGKYRYEMSQADHKNLLELLLTCKSAIVISSYNNSLYDSMLAKWYKLQKQTFCHLEGTTRQKKATRGERIEAIWYNAKAAEMLDTEPLFNNIVEEETKEEMLD